MPIPIVCPGCKKSLRAPDNSVGGKVKCPHCGTAMEIRRPAATTIPPVISRPQLKNMPKQLILKVSLGLGTAIIAIIVLVLIVRSSGQRTEQRAGAEPAAKSNPKNQATDFSKNSTTKEEKEKNVVEVKRKEDEPAQEKESPKIPGIGDEEKQVEESIRNAIALQAPPLEKGKYADTGDFGKKIRNLVTNEFAFGEAKNQVYRSTFNQKQLEYSALLKNFHARNAVVGPGKYDFDSGDYFLDLIFWQALYEEKRQQEGQVNPRTDDICRLQTAVKLDAKTARRWREAIDKGTFSLTIWYRMAKIERATWQQNPHWNPVPMPAHDIAIAVEILKFEEEKSDASMMQNSGPAAEKLHANARTVSLPRQLADSYINSIEHKGLLRRAVFADIYKNPNAEDSFAVCYSVSEVNRKSVVNQLVHVFVFKDNARQWRISAFSPDGIHVALGPPPRGFTKISDPVNAQ